MYNTFFGSNKIFAEENENALNIAKRHLDSESWKKSPQCDVNLFSMKCKSVDGEEREKIKCREKW